MGKKVFTVQLTDNKVVYYGGDTINGNLVLDNDETFSATSKLRFLQMLSYCYYFFEHIGQYCVTCYKFILNCFSDRSCFFWQSVCSMDRGWWRKFHDLHRKTKIFQAQGTSNRFDCAWFWFVCLLWFLESMWDSCVVKECFVFFGKSFIDVPTTFSCSSLLNLHEGEQSLTVSLNNCSTHQICLPAFISSSMPMIT